MPAHMWSDSGTWIALGISLLFLVVGFAMHRVIRTVLKAPDPSTDPVASLTGQKPPDLPPSSSDNNKDSA